MNLKRTLFTGLAAAGLMASVAAPIASAQDVSGSGTTSATVNVGEGGVFSVAFCDATNALTDVPAMTSVTNATSTGTLQICYADTLTYHNQALVSFGAIDFTSIDSNGDTPIPASGFKVTKTWNTVQDHWLGDTHGHTLLADPGFLNEFGVAPPQNAAGAATWNANNSLDTDKNVGFIYNGSGAGDTTADVDVSLLIPAGTAAGNYSSTVTVTVIPGGTHIHP